MSISRAVMLLALMSFPALAKVSLEEKRYAGGVS